MGLDPKPARPLTSREIAKVIGAVLGGFVTWCGKKPVIEALDHLIEHRDGYVSEFEFIQYMSEANNAIEQARIRSLGSDNPSPSGEKEAK